MDSVFNSFTILERKLFVPLSEEIGLSVDKVRILLQHLPPEIKFTSTDSLCRATFHFNTSWNFYEIRSTPFKS